MTGSEHAIQSGGELVPPEGQQMDGPLSRAIIDALPDGTTFGFNIDADERTWMHVIGPGDSRDPAITREVLNTALASLERPTPGR